MRHKYRLVLLAALLAKLSLGQTLVDLRTQSKSIDFSALPSTRPVQVGSTLPASCLVGQMFFKSDAPAGANLYGCTAANVWTVMSGGTVGQGGASMASELGDLQLARTSNTVLAIGANCSATRPCNARFGALVFSISSGATATVSGTSSGMLYVYVASGGTLTVGHNLQGSVACSGCTAQAGVTSFPPDALPLGTWTVSNGALDAKGGQDFRAVLSTKNITAGLGIAVADANGTAAVSLDTTLTGIRVPVPLSSTSSCQAGSWSYDTSYLYLCVAPNTWRRSQLAAW